MPAVVNQVAGMACTICTSPCALHDRVGCRCCCCCCCRCRPQAQGCQYLGVWEQGQFVSGTWAHREGSQFQGTFAQSQPVSGVGAPRQGAAGVLQQ
jgi:hypothetical protein